ncbi:MAG: hypothetical protein Q4P66_09745 [Actinomycetaceae bacterium]|nr:hypothetical protein [Actinomycetaceae bacterium]
MGDNSIMNTYESAVLAINNPQCSSSELVGIAQVFPQLHHRVVSHPSVDGQVLQFLASFGSGHNVGQIGFFIFG